MSEREFWIAIRQALLLIVSVIERKYKLGKYAGNITQTIGENDSIATAL